MTGYSSYQFMLFRLAVALPLLANLWPLPRNSGPLLWLALPWILGALLLLILLGAFRRIASVLFLSIFLAQIVPGLLRPPMNPDQWLALLGPVASFLITQAWFANVSWFTWPPPAWAVWYATSLPSKSIQ